MHALKATIDDVHARLPGVRLTAGTPPGLEAPTRTGLLRSLDPLAVA